MSTCHSRSRSIFHCSSLKSSDDVTHTHHFMSVPGNPSFPMSPDMVSRIFRCPSPHSYTLACRAESGLTFSSLTFCCLFHRTLRMIWMWDPDGPKSVSLDLVLEWPSLSLVYLPDSEDLKLPGGAFWSWTQMNFWAWGFSGEIFLGLAVSLMGRVQVKE